MFMGNLAKSQAVALLNSEGELQDCVSCVYCAALNPVDGDRCEACGEALGGRAVERRLLMARISTYASHMGQSKYRRHTVEWERDTFEESGHEDEPERRWWGFTIIDRGHQSLLSLADRIPTQLFIGFVLGILLAVSLYFIGSVILAVVIRFM